jgi:hypothetical protein
MANLDGIAQFEFHRMQVCSSFHSPFPNLCSTVFCQLTASLTAVAESMRNSAKMADTFANIIKQSSFAPNSPAMHMIQGMNQMFPEGNLYALNGSAPGPSGPQQTPAAAAPPTTISRTTGGKRKAAALEEGVEGGKTKRTRKPKDPNAPKRPASSYILFQNDIRKELKAKHPNIANSELLAMIAKQWQAMSDDDKSVSRVIYVIPFNSLTKLCPRIRYTTKRRQVLRNGTPQTRRLTTRVLPRKLPLPMQPPLLLLPCVLEYEFFEGIQILIPAIVKKGHSENSYPKGNCCGCCSSHTSLCSREICSTIGDFSEFRIF